MEGLVLIPIGQAICKTEIVHNLVSAIHLKQSSIKLKPYTAIYFI